MSQIITTENLKKLHDYKLVMKYVNVIIKIIVTII